MKQQYKSYDETCDFLYEMQSKYSTLIKVESIGKTEEGRDILLATISLDVECERGKPALLVTGTAHAREWIGNELSVAFISYILENYSKNPNLYKIIQQNTLYIVPILNPDGFEYSKKHFSFWRKNRRDNGDGTFGVDLNRNFSVGYQKSTNTSSNVYGGTEPFSEPETRAIKEFVDSHDNITIALDYHSQGNVFFPAHKFNHEPEVEGTDMNILCANMNYFITKTTGRKYGINRGKPPTKLISGSGREYYYSKGIIAIVVEVGTRNIPDFLQNMTESIRENIPALTHALSEARNYSKDIAPKRVKSFYVDSVTSSSIELKWDYEVADNIYFEIYRTNNNKIACNENSLLAITNELSLIDDNISSGDLYFYYIRAYDKNSGAKSPFAPKTRARTLLDCDEFAKTIFPNRDKVGYVAQNLVETNRRHFGKNSLFVGVNESRGVHYGLIELDLSAIPEDAIIKESHISLYPLNRVSAKIESYGEWNITILDSETIADITDFEQVKKAKVVESIGQAIPSEKLTQGIWSHWNLNEYERKLLQKQLKNKKLILRVQGPTTLPIGASSQVMSFDLGYGKYGGGIHYRPHIDIKYTIPSQTQEIKISCKSTISKQESTEDRLSCGYDKDNNKIYGLFNFDLDSLPNPDETVITEAWIEITNKTKVKKRSDLHYNVEFVDSIEFDYESIRNRERIEFIGYEVQSNALRYEKRHQFIFDSFSRLALEEKHKNSHNAHFVIKPTSSTVKNYLINWYDSGKFEPKLVVKYIKRNRKVIQHAKNFKATVENEKVKLTWDCDSDENYVGMHVVRNRFHKPKNPFDGDKIYAGRDNYSLDNFGNASISKYYSIFTYDDVPNYSEPLSIEYKA